MGAWQAPLPLRLAATLALLALLKRFRGDEGGESCEAEGGRGRGSGGLSHCKMHCREAQMDQWAAVCCDAKYVLLHIRIRKDTRKKKKKHKACTTKGYNHFATLSIRCFEPNGIAHCTYTQTHRR